jgi:hypothetical protein
MELWEEMFVAVPRSEAPHLSALDLTSYEQQPHLTVDLLVSINGDKNTAQI